MKYYVLSKFYDNGNVHVGAYSENQLEDRPLLKEDIKKGSRAEEDCDIYIDVCNSIPETAKFLKHPDVTRILY